MKKIILGGLLICSLVSISGCAQIKTWFGDKTVEQITFAQADRQALNTIGKEYVWYSENDTGLTTDTLTARLDVYKAWQTSGATETTYNFVVPVYQNYFENNPLLEDNDKTARRQNVQAFKLYIDEKK